MGPPLVLGRCVVQTAQAVHGLLQTGATLNPLMTLSCPGVFMRVLVRQHVHSDSSNSIGVKTAVQSKQPQQMVSPAQNDTTA